MHITNILRYSPIEAATDPEEAANINDLGENINFAISWDFFTFSCDKVII